MTVTEVVTSIHSFISFAWWQTRRGSPPFLLGSSNHSPSSYLLALEMHPTPHLHYLTLASGSWISSEYLSICFYTPFVACFACSVTLPSQAKSRRSQVFFHVTCSHSCKPSVLSLPDGAFPVHSVQDSTLHTPQHHMAHWSPASLLLAVVQPTLLL